MFKKTIEQSSNIVNEGPSSSTPSVIEICRPTVSVLTTQNVAKAILGVRAEANGGGAVEVKSQVKVLEELEFSLTTNQSLT